MGVKRMKEVIDVCCGGRHMWFDKENKNTVFMDIRRVEPGSIELRPNWSVQPCVLGSFEKIPFQNNSFNLVVCDPPHKIKHSSGLIIQKYGFLGDEWEYKIKNMFNECWRILSPGGTLIIKWADVDIPPRKILALFSKKMLFGTHTKKGTNNTYFWTFYKPKVKE